MDPIQILFDEIQKVNIKSLIDINSKFASLFKGNVYIPIDKSSILENLDKIKHESIIYDGCAIAGLFWSLPLDTAERIISILAQKTVYLFIWESASPHLQDWQDLLARYSFEKVTDKSVASLGVLQVWKWKDAKIKSMLPPPSSVEPPVEIPKEETKAAEPEVPVLPEAADYTTEPKKRTRYKRKEAKK